LGQSNDIYAGVSHGTSPGDGMIAAN